MTAAPLTLVSSELAAHLVPAARLEEKRRTLPTGLPALDQVLGGGWPRGALAELSGRRSSGRTSVALASLAAAQARGETVALVDAGGALDPRAAARAGVALAHLVWVRAAAAEALRAAALLVAAGGFGLVVLDLGDAQLPRPPIPSAAWVRLSREAEKQGTALVVSTPWRKLGTFAAAALAMGALDAGFAGGGPAPRLLLGLDTHATLLRSRARSVAPPADAPRLTWRLGEPALQTPPAAPLHARLLNEC